MKNYFIKSLTIMIGVLLMPLVISAQTLEYHLFETAQAKKEVADEEMSFIFSPETYDKAQECFEQAKEEYNEAGELEDIRESLNDAIILFDESIRNNERAKEVFCICD